MADIPFHLNPQPSGNMGRKAERYEAVMTAILRVPGQDGRVDEITISTKDISSTGLAMECDRPLKPGLVFDAELALPDDTLISALRCEVRWCNEATKEPPCFRVGLAFTKLEKEQDKALRDFFRTFLFQRWGSRQN